MYKLTGAAVGSSAGVAGAFGTPPSQNNDIAAVFGSAPMWHGKDRSGGAAVPLCFPSRGRCSGARHPPRSRTPARRCVPLGCGPHGVHCTSTRGRHRKRAWMFSGERCEVLSPSTAHIYEVEAGTLRGMGLCEAWPWHIFVTHVDDCHVCAGRGFDVGGWILDGVGSWRRS